METKKETQIDYFVVIPALFSMILMLNYYFSYFVISRTIKGYNIDTFSILSVEDVLFPLASTNGAAFVSMLLLICSILIMSYLINQIYDQNKKLIKGILAKYVNAIFFKYWYIIAAVLLLVLGWLSFLSDGIYFIMLVLGVLIFKYSNVLSPKNCFIIFVIFVCSLHLFYDLILKNSVEKENQSYFLAMIKTQDNQTYKIDSDLRIVFWGAKYVILRRRKSNEVELIPTSEIKHTLIKCDG